MKPTLLTLALLLPLSVQAATDIQRWRNRDGTQILLVERHENPIIDLEVSFKGAGSVANPDGKSQVAEFTAALLTDGTQELDEEPSMPKPTTSAHKSAATAMPKAHPQASAASVKPTSATKPPTCSTTR